jgi:drug/metabolite transporter (DMT)-like permease
VKDPGKAFLWAALAIFAGYFLTFGFKVPDLETNIQTIHASLFALLAAASFGSATVFGKKILIRYSFYTATFYRYGFTALLLLVFVILPGRFDQLALTTPGNWLIFLSLPSHRIRSHIPLLLRFEESAGNGGNHMRTVFPAHCHRT